MPNWCANTLVLEHSDPVMITRAKDAFAGGRFCEEFAPCPNPDDWYNHNINEWGTKWDFGHGDGINDFTEHSLTVYFDSAWAPPIAMMEKLEALGFAVNLMYYEPGMAFCGRYSDGDDEYYEYGGFSSDQVADVVPQEIDETFSISEQMAEYEAENEED